MKSRNKKQNQQTTQYKNLAEEESLSSKLPVNSRFSFRTSKTLLFLFITGLILTSRLLFLSADPPYVSWSQDLLTDPFQYVSFARSKILWGQWDLFGQDLFLLWKNSALTLFSFLSFKLLGIGRLQANLTAVVLNISSLFFLFLALRKTNGYRAAVFSVLLLGADFTFLAYGRETFAEVSVIFFLSLGFYLLVHGSRKALFLWLAGALHMCSILFGKMLAVFILPACLAVLFSITVKEPRKRILPVLHFLGGASIIFLPWFVLVYNPASRHISGYLSEMSVGMYGLPEALESINHFLLSFFSFGQVSKVFPDMPALSIETDFFYKLPVIFVIAFLFMIYWFSRFLGRRKILDTFKSFSIPEVYSVFWFVFGFLVLMPWNYRPLRYQTLLIPPLAIMAGLGLDRFLSPDDKSKDKKLPNLFWISSVFICILLISTFLFFHVFSFVIKLTKNYGSFGNVLLVSFVLSLLSTVGILAARRRLSVRPPIKIRACIVVFLILCCLAVNLLFILPWLSKPKFSLVNSSQDLGMILNEDAVISGSYAATLSPNNQTKLVLHMFGATKSDPLLFKKYPITHLVLERNGNRKRAYQDYPEIMQNAQVIATYYIRDIMPVDIYRVAGGTGNSVTDAYRLSLFERADLAIKNKQLDSATTLMAKFNRENPNNLSGYLSLAKLYVEQKDYTKASEYTLKALQFDKMNFALHELLGWTYLQLSIQKKNDTYRTLGIREWEIATRICPENMQLRQALDEIR